MEKNESERIVYFITNPKVLQIVKYLKDIDSYLIVE
jgi:hypothetical protein